MKRRAFTLIELMIVVAIFSVLAAIVVPFLLSSRPAKSQPKPEATVSVASEPQEPAASPPLLGDVRLEIRLQSERRRDGLEVYSEYQADVHGRLQVPASSEAVGLWCPFPAGTNEARNAMLAFEEEGRLREPEGVEYRPHGIGWTGTLDQPTTVVVSFTALGRDKFVCRLPAHRRIRELAATVDLSGVESPAIPPSGLSATNVTSEQANWRLTNLVTDRPLVVEFPGAASPLGRASQLFQLTGLAILLFGMGFWYLSELYRPGQLDRFHFVDFFLLATTYSLFFVIFAVIEFHEGLPTVGALGVSALISLPLLALHTSRIVNFTFAVTRATPAAVLTGGLVVNGVYGGPLRDFVYLGAGVLTVIFITLTYRPFRARRQERRLGKEALLVEKVVALIARARACEGLRPQMTLASQTAQVGERLRRSVPKLLEELKEVTEAVDGMERNLERLRVASEEDRHNVASTLQWELERLTGQLPYLESHLGESLVQLESTAVRSSETRHCIACGKAHPSTPFCPHCGTTTATELTCCQETILLPRHLLDALPDNLCCPACGLNHRLGTQPEAVEAG